MLSLAVRNIEIAFNNFYITKMSYYAVAKGREIGIFQSWPECQRQIHGFSGAKYKKFKTKNEAESYLNENTSDKSSSSTVLSAIPSSSSTSRTEAKTLENENYKFKRAASKLKRQTIRLAKQKILSNNDNDKINNSVRNKSLELNSEEEHLLASFSDEDNDKGDDSKTEKNDFNNLFDDSYNDLLMKLETTENNQEKMSTSQKRKTDLKADKTLPSSKIAKYDSIIYEPVGMKKFGNYEFPIDENEYVIVYTDGGCQNNGKMNAAAGFGVYFDENHPLNISGPVDGKPTNNSGEIQAAICALNIAKNNGINKIIINTDSQFLINSATKWIWNWYKNNWKLSSGGQVKVKDFQKLYPFLIDKTINIKWNYTKGHSGIKGNEEADALAQKGIEKYEQLHSKEK